MASHGLGWCPLVLIWNLANVLEERDVCSYCLQGVGEEGDAGTQSCPASGLALVRPYLLSAEFLHVHISNLELNAKCVSPKGLKVPWHVALVAAESGLEKEPVGAGRADGNAGRNTPHADTE